VLLGNQNFRPVGLALAPDGSLLMSDWVDKSYPLHNKGRVWRLSAKNRPPRKEPKDDWEALASLHRPTRDAALSRLRRGNPQAMAPYDLVLQAKHEDVQVSAGRLLPTNDYSGGSLLMALIASHPSANVRDGLVDHFYLSLAESPNTGFDPRWLQAPKLLLADESTRPLALAALSRYGLGRATTAPVNLGTSAAVWSAVRTDPYLLHAAMLGEQFSFELIRQRRADKDTVLQKMDSTIPEQRLALALAAWKGGALQASELAAELLADSDPRLQLVGLLWLAESPPADGAKYRWRVENLLKRPQVTRQVFEVALATLDAIDGVRRDPKNEPKGDDFLLRLLQAESTPSEIRRLALRSIAPSEPSLKNELLTGLLANPDLPLRLEAIRTIRQRADAPRWPQLRDIAASADRPAE
jgi:hypothetical protein